MGAKYIRDIIQRMVALEEQTDGVAKKELERVLYVRISDFDQFSKLPRIFQEQWTVVSKDESGKKLGTVRVRQVIENSNTSYVLTAKCMLGQGQNTEVSTSTSKDLFNVFKTIAENGMIKDRYEFPVGNRKFELDLFIDEAEEYSVWGKVDYEVEDMNEPIPDLPFKVDEVIMDNDPDKKDFITELYSKYFLTKRK